jgi:hypothetical protein
MQPVGRDERSTVNVRAKIDRGPSPGNEGGHNASNTGKTGDRGVDEPLGPSDQPAPEIISATIFPELSTPGTPAPGCVPAPTR